MTEEILEEMAEAVNITPADESPEQIQKRIEREEWRLRAEAAHRDREDIFRRNGLLKPGESLPVDEAALNARCCGK